MTITLPSPAVTTRGTSSDFTTVLSQVRNKVGDTGGLDATGRVYLSDERIAAAYTEHPTVLGAAIECCKQILAEVAKDTDFTAGAISTQRTQITAQFEGVLKRLESERGDSVQVFVGGQSYAAARVIDSNSDIPARAFRVGMDRNV